MNRLSLKISCFVVSVLIWMQVASTAEVEKVARLDVRVVGLGQGLTVAGSRIPGSIDVRLTGSKLHLLTHKYFDRYIGEFNVDLSDQGPGPAFYYEPVESAVFTDLRNPSLVSNGSFEVRVDTLLTRRVPVALATRGRLPERLGFVTAPVLDPDSVDVTGPSRFFPDAFSVRTDAVELANVTGSGERALSLVSPHDLLTLDHEKIEVKFLVGTIVERTLANVPVVPLVGVGQPPVGVSPPVADVMIKGVADSVASVTADRFALTLPVDGLAEGIYEVPGQVDYPSWLTAVRTSPEVFTVIVGDPPLAKKTPAAATAEDRRDE